MPAPAQGDSRTAVVCGLRSPGPLAAWRGNRPIFLLTSMPPARSPHTPRQGRDVGPSHFCFPHVPKLLFSRNVVGAESPRGQSWAPPEHPSHSTTTTRGQGDSQLSSEGSSPDSCHSAVSPQGHRDNPRGFLGSLFTLPLGQMQH